MCVRSSKGWARFVFRAGRASALGWTISKIVFEAQRVLLHWLDKLSRGLVPKWHNLAGLISELSRGSWGLQEGSLQARNRIGARLVRSWQSPLSNFSLDR